MHVPILSTLQWSLLVLSCVPACIRLWINVCGLGNIKIPLWHLPTHDIERNILSLIVPILLRAHLATPETQIFLYLPAGKVLITLIHILALAFFEYDRVRRHVWHIPSMHLRDT